MMSVIGLTNTSRHAFSSMVGIGSRLQDKVDLGTSVEYDITDEHPLETLHKETI